MKKFLPRLTFGLLALVCLAFTASSAYADGIVLVGSSTLRPDGVGLRTVLSLQSPGSKSTESGGIKWTGSADQTFGDVLRGGTNNTVSLTDLGVTRDSTAVQIGINVNEASRGTGSDPIVVTAMTLTAYDSSGNAVFSANLINGPYTLQLLGNGQGTADYIFTPDQEAAARLAAVYDPNLRIGLQATITNAQGGPESFYFGVGKASTPVPEPTTMLLLGTGLAGLAARARKRRNKGEKA